MTSRVGYVVIGRNEGERLLACLASLARVAGPVVYVDSGSTDGSVDASSRAGAHVVALDMSTPFTAARGRNAGLKALVAIAPDTDLVQFIDGDCELAEGWIEKARAFLDAEPSFGAACGRRREKFPEKSVYNRLCDEEWATPVGEAAAFGGDVMIRRAAIEVAGGFNPTLIAGEEPELGVRLRAHGFRIMRLDAEMTRHDAAIMRFSQWWRRTARGGHAFAEVARLHCRSPQRIWRREAIRPLPWAAVAPAALLGAAFVSPLFLIALLAYPAQAARIRARRRGRGGWSYATFAMLAKFAEAQGVLGYWFGAFFGRRQKLIEYKR